jgi:predicted nucleotidyltransferase
VSALAEDLISAVTHILQEHADVKVAFLFGSLASGRVRPDSDIDLGVASDAPLSPGRKLQLMDELAIATGRTIDLVDLTTASFTLLGQALKGRRLLVRDTGIYAAILRKLWYDVADIKPNYDYVLQRRRERFTRG